LLIAACLYFRYIVTPPLFFHLLSADYLMLPCFRYYAYAAALMPPLLADFR